MYEIATQVSGWVGMVLIVAAYFLNSRKMLDSQSKTYQCMNLFGSAGVFVNVFHQRAWPAVALQVTWGMIAVLTLVKGQKHCQ